MQGSSIAAPRTRERHTCSGTEDALISSTEDNERTYLLARWFQCVKLPPDVLADDHPFRNPFPGEKPAHLFVANHDGSGRHDLVCTRGASCGTPWRARSRPATRAATPRPCGD